jgi:nucleoside-diphosphate-sugar epimerase
METEGLAGEVVNLGNPDEHTILEFAQRIIELAGNGDSRIVHEPLPIDDPRRRCPDITRARQLLGWSPMIGLDEGLGRTIAFFRDGTFSSFD